jgi:hypothetical protein
VPREALTVYHICFYQIGSSSVRSFSAATGRQQTPNCLMLQSSAACAADPSKSDPGISRSCATALSTLPSGPNRKKKQIPFLSRRLRKTQPSRKELCLSRRTICAGMHTRRTKTLIAFWTHSAKQRTRFAYLLSVTSTDACWRPPGCLR